MGRSKTVFAVFILLSVFVIAAREIHDTDAWLHLTLGKLIWEHKGLPENELYPYPSFDLPFSYSSWLFGLTVYLVYLGFGSAGLVIFKASIITAAILWIYLDSLRPHRNIPLAAFILTGTLFIVFFRFVLRPDIFLMLFLSFIIFSLNAYLYDNKKYLYLLPIIHCIWANSHSSIILMVVPFISFLLGSLIQKYLTAKNISTHFCPTNKQLKTVFIIMILSLLAVFVTPYSWSQYFYGFHVLDIDIYKETIVELAPLKFSINSLTIVIILIFLSFILNLRNISFIHLFLAIPFLIMPFVAIRFIFLVGIVGLPILIRNIGEFVSRHNLKAIVDHMTVKIITILWIIVFTIVSAMNVHPLGRFEANIGLGFNYSQVPKGAVDYMNKNNIQGRVLNTFHFGQYIIWTGYPKRTVFWDARGYIPKEELQAENAMMALKAYSKSVIDALYNKYGFETILMEQGQGKREKFTQVLSEDPAFSHPDWALVYWDDISGLYIRRNETYKKIIERDEYRYIKPDTPREYFVNSIDTKINQDKLVNELKRNIKETNSRSAHIYLGLLYNNTNQYDLTINLLSGLAVGSDQSLNFYRNVILGDAYRNTAVLQKNRTYLNKALHYYFRAMKIGKNSKIFYNIGLIYSDLDHLNLGIKYLSKSVREDKRHITAYKELKKLYLRVGDKEKADEIQKKITYFYKDNYALDYFNEANKEYLNKNYVGAIEKFKKVLELNPNHVPSITNIGYIYYDLNDYKTAENYFENAIRVDPKHGDAYYGLAILYKKQERITEAIDKFNMYLKYEPHGYWSRKARREIRQLGKK